MTLSVQAPEGAHFELEEVKTNHGQQSLGEKPILVWDSVDKGLEFFTNDEVLSIWDGTSLRVSFQSIMRRLAIAGKTDNEIAQAQLDFRPGKRVVGASTPASRAGNAARKVAEKLGDKADLLTSLLADIESGKITADDLAALKQG